MIASQSMYKNEDEELMYNLTAKHIIDQYGTKKGVCMEIGIGPGYLGLQLANQSDMSMYMVDIDKEAIEKSKKNEKLFQIKDEINFVQADVAELPFDDNVADLIVSRGSMWFWHDQLNGLKEIYRVLKPNGVAFIGGGFGKCFLPKDLWERVVAYKKEQLKAYKKEKGMDIPALVPSEEKLIELLTAAAIPEYRLIKDYPGIWIEIKK